MQHPFMNIQMNIVLMIHRLWSTDQGLVQMLWILLISLIDNLWIVWDKQVSKIEKIHFRVKSHYRQRELGEMKWLNLGSLKVIKQKEIVVQERKDHREVWKILLIYKIVLNWLKDLEVYLLGIGKEVIQ